MSAEVPPASSRRVVPWGPIASYVGLVECLPFAARFEGIQVTRDAKGIMLEERATGFIHRESTGRVRHEVRAEGGELDGYEAVVIFDLAARTATALDVVEKRATRFTDMGPAPGEEVGVRGWGFSGPWSLGTSPEGRVIEGVACRKAQPVAWPVGSAGDPKVTGEIWVSDEIKFSVLERVSDAERDYTWRLYDIRRVEPPSSLFVIPAEYTQVVRSKYVAAPRER